MLSRRGLGRGRRLLRVALLLLLFGTSANGQEEHTKVGAGQHTLKDGKVHLAPGWNTKDNYDCEVKESDDKFIVSHKYFAKGCTVDLVTSDEKDEFKSVEVPEPMCIDEKKAVPPPRFWPIANAKDKDGKKPMRLLVFHLLPLLMAKSRLRGPPLVPKCRLSIHFSKDKYSLLNEKALTISTSPQSKTAAKHSSSSSSVQNGRQAFLFLLWFCLLLFCRDVDTEDEQRETASHGTAAAAAAAGEVEKEQQPQHQAAEEEEEASVGEQLV